MELLITSKMVDVQAECVSPNVKYVLNYKLNTSSIESVYASVYKVVDGEENFIGSVTYSGGQINVNIEFINRELMGPITTEFNDIIDTINLSLENV